MCMWLWTYHASVCMWFVDPPELNKEQVKIVAGDGEGLTRLSFDQLAMSLTHLSLNKDRYVSLLEKLIGETEFLQDNPPKFIPQEDRYAVIHGSPWMRFSDFIPSL